MELQRLQIYWERAVGIAETKSLKAAADDDLNDSCNQFWWIKIHADKVNIASEFYLPKSAYLTAWDMQTFNKDWSTFGELQHRLGGTESNVYLSDWQYPEISSNANWMQPSQVSKM